jgi:hypothetical protein
MALAIRVMSNDREQGLKEMVESNPFTCLHINIHLRRRRRGMRMSTRLQEKKGLYPPPFLTKAHAYTPELHASRTKFTCNHYT